MVQLLGQVFTLNPSEQTPYSYSSVNNAGESTTTSCWHQRQIRLDCVSTSSAVATVKRGLPHPQYQLTVELFVTDKVFYADRQWRQHLYIQRRKCGEPAITTTYAVIGSSTANCVSTNTAIATVTVFALPSVSVSPQTIL